MLNQVHIVNQPKPINTICIFTDAATSPQTGVAIGAFVCLSEHLLDEYVHSSIEILSDKLSHGIIYSEYKSKKSTFSEIKTVITALDYLHKNLASDCKIEIYTDCQSVCDLLGQRREKLERNKYMTRAGNEIQNASLYKELFALADQYQIKTFKIKGHHSQLSRLTIQEKVFAVLDRQSRKHLRSVLKHK